MNQNFNLNFMINKIKHNIDLNPKTTEKTMLSIMNDLSITKLFNIIKTYKSDHKLVW